MVWILFQSPVLSEVSLHYIDYRFVQNTWKCEIFAIPEKKAVERLLLLSVQQLFFLLPFPPESCSAKKTLEYSVINVVVKGLT